MIMPEARSVIVLGMGYFTGSGNIFPESGRFARYAWGDDYHPVIEEMLKDLDELLQVYGGIQKYYVDTGPVLERAWAQEAGLGWQGKSASRWMP